MSQNFPQPVRISGPKEDELVFDWHALAVEGGKIFVSNGNVEDIIFLVTTSTPQTTGSLLHSSGDQLVEGTDELVPTNTAVSTTESATDIGVENLDTVGLLQDEDLDLVDAPAEVSVPAEETPIVSSE